MNKLYEAPNAERIDFAALEALANLTDLPSGVGGGRSSNSLDDEYT